MSDFNLVIERMISSNLTVNFSNEEDGVIVVSAGKLIKNMEMLLKGLGVNAQYVVTRNECVSGDFQVSVSGDWM